MMRLRRLRESRTYNDFLICKTFVTVGTNQRQAGAITRRDCPKSVRIPGGERLTNFYKNIYNQTVTYLSGWIMILAQIMLNNPWIHNFGQSVFLPCAFLVRL